ncbi:MAG TPA: hypothetical protein VFF19_35270, partial [Reyranella sp.]|nr:hypothetical protein [Reyranella sp.]
AVIVCEQVAASAATCRRVGVQPDEAHQRVRGVDFAFGQALAQRGWISPPVPAGFAVTSVTSAGSSFRGAMIQVQRLICALGVPVARRQAQPAPQQAQRARVMGQAPRPARARWRA